MVGIEQVGSAVAVVMAAGLGAVVAFDFARRRLAGGAGTLILPGLAALVITAGAALSVVHNRTGESLVWLFGSETVDFGVSEFGVVAGLLLACGLLVVLAIREDSWGRWPLVLAGLACFAIAGEELSWGQWIFHWETPDALAQVNLQNETNLHNLVDPRLYDLVYGAAGFVVLAAAAVFYFLGRRIWFSNGFMSRMAGCATQWLRGSSAGLVVTLSAAVLLQHELFEEYSEFVLAIAACLFLLHVVKQPVRRSIRGVAHA